MDNSCILILFRVSLCLVLMFLRARKLLKVKELKYNFSFSKLFHNPVEKPVENFFAAQFSTLFFSYLRVSKKCFW